MKKAALFIFAVFFVTLISCEKEETTTPIINEPQLTEQEQADIIFSREQEKLSRDLFLYTYSKYPNPVFLQIAGSQQVRITEIKDLLDKYEIIDPASADTGIFSTTEFQNYYNKLVLQVDESLETAIIAVMEIEDLAIRDISVYISNTSKEDILYTYDFMKCTSKNHLRWLYPELQAESGSYTPQYISQEEYDDIINTPLFQCR